MIKQFIKSIREEKDGFSFDQPWRLEEKSLGVIVPILRISQQQRSYITLAEAKEVKIEDTGQIDYIYVKNNEEKPVLISRGEIFRGKSQERAAIHDHIIMPGKALRVAVRCIHQTRGIVTGTQMKYGGRAPYAVSYASQGETWRGVDNYCFAAQAMAEPSGTGPREPFEVANQINIPHASDLTATLDSISDAVKAAMKKIPPIENQVGAVFFHENAMLGMDLYDLSKSWDAVKQDVIEKEGASFIKKDEGADMFEFKPSRSKSLIGKYLSAIFEEKEIYNREYRLVELRSDKLIGEVVEFKGRVIHLTFWKKG